MGVSSKDSYEDHAKPQQGSGPCSHLCGTPTLHSFLANRTDAFPTFFEV